MAGSDDWVVPRRGRRPDGRPAREAPASSRARAPASRSGCRSARRRPWSPSSARGVLDAFVTSLSGSQPVVQVPVKPEYAPNVFLSVLAVRGRVWATSSPPALADLGKPAFKLGVAEVRVGWRAHELRVAVTPERQAYRVRRDGPGEDRRPHGRRQAPAGRAARSPWPRWTRDSWS